MKKVLFVCEGSTEVFLLYKILEKELSMTINEELKNNGNLVLKNINGVLTLFAEKGQLVIYVENLDGESNLIKYTNELCDSREFEEISHILFIMDADYKAGDESGFSRTEKAIKKAERMIKKCDNEKLISFFITPNNESDGMTENILVEAVECKEITSYIKGEVIPKICEMDGNEITNKDKSTFMMVAATQNPLRGTASSFISSCYNKLDKDSEYLKKLIIFIKSNLE